MLTVFAMFAAIFQRYAICRHYAAYTYMHFAAKIAASAIFFYHAACDMHRSLAFFAIISIDAAALIISLLFSMSHIYDTP